ncbi:mitogen-activated protein kinase [Physcia stellaris]|nr:mitogen-activated protein kinase [Physcia stellaris]
MTDLQGRKVFKVFNQDFIVDERYNVTKELGQGAYGIVCPSAFCDTESTSKPETDIVGGSAATNNQTGEGVAIKKVTNVFSKKILAKRALREIKLLQHFRGHRNITCLYDMDIPRPDNFNETYLYEELMEQHVRVQQPQAQMGGPMGQAQGNVPIPDNTSQWSHEDPRPQEAAVPQHVQNMGLEQELQGGLDAMHGVTG